MKLRFFGVAILTTLLLAEVSGAQEWAQKMFKIKSHDFGVVARNSKTEYAFEIENPYAVDVHITAVRASCGCTTPAITKQQLTTYEKGSILTTYNTGAFLGKRGATLTVTFDQPRYAEVQLKVTGFIRSDVQIQPGGISFGAVDQGHSAEKSVHVRYFGGKPWRITEVLGASDHIDFTWNRVPGDLRQASYQLTARLKDNAPIGYFANQLTLVTNDAGTKHLPVRVEGRIVAPITVRPASLFLGVVRPGEQITKKLVVRGKQPFRILAVHPEDDRFSFQISDDAKKLHIIPLTFTAGPNVTKIVETIEVHTDLGDGVIATCTASAAVVESVASR